MEEKEAQYLHALEVAWDKFLTLEPLEIARNADVNLDIAKNVFTVSFLNEFYYVNSKTREVLTSNSKSAGILPSLLILKYLIAAKPIPLANKLISFRDLHGGNIYYGVFERAVLKPLAKHFSSKPEYLIKSAQFLSGRKLEYGSASIEIQVFPRLPITIIVWKGDEEVPGSANVVFDESAKYQLSAEEICVLCTLVVSRLLKALTSH